MNKTRMLMTGDQELSIREHVRRQFSLLEHYGEEMLEERRLKATHVLRRMSLFERRARDESVRLIKSAPRRVKEALNRYDLAAEHAVYDTT